MSVDPMPPVFRPIPTVESQKHILPLQVRQQSAGTAEILHAIFWEKLFRAPFAIEKFNDGNGVSCVARRRDES